MFLFAALGWLLVAVMAVLRWIAPKTETKADDEVLGRLNLVGRSVLLLWAHEV
jgi:hypothetical protein